MKLNILSKVAQDSGFPAVTREFGIGKTTVRIRIMKARENIMRLLRSNAQFCI